MKAESADTLESSVPASRVRALNSDSVSRKGDFVLYWMTAFRRLEYNFSLQRAVEWARQLDKPLVILEALRCDYPWSSPRLHRFILQGMAEHKERLRDARVLYYPFVERKKGEGKGLLEALAKHSCLVVGDDYPCFFLPRMLQSAASRLEILLEAIDSNGILPLRSADKLYLRAYDFRRFLQRNLKPHLAEMAKDYPLQGDPLTRLAGLPKKIEKRWPPAGDELLAASDELLSSLPLQYQVSPTDLEGGTRRAGQALELFLEEKLPHYDEARNEPQREVTSGLSPYLHFGHISPHGILQEVLKREQIDPLDFRPQTPGKTKSWWKASPSAQGFLDQLLTWRELGFNFCSRRKDYDQYESLPDWARKTLREHADDPREHLYELEEFEAAATHDELWNAAQRQLLREGRIHNYMRMVWGKKILEWTESPRQAASVMIHLNDKYALDGRDPNSYSGIFWCLGRYDRAWGPERPIFGKIRYMSSENTARKFKVQKYLERFSE